MKGNFVVRSEFSCVRSSHDLCARAQLACNPQISITNQHFLISIGPLTNQQISIYLRSSRYDTLSIFLKCNNIIPINQHNRLLHSVLTVSFYIQHFLISILHPVTPKSARQSAFSNQHCILSKLALYPACATRYAGDRTKW